MPAMGPAAAERVALVAALHEWRDGASGQVRKQGPQEANLQTWHASGVRLSAAALTPLER